MIFTGFSPNNNGRDSLTALSYLLLPWKWFSWKNGSYIQKATKQLQSTLGVQQEPILYDSGRSALYFALKALNVGKGDEVLVQAYTCVVVINAIKWTGAEPVYVDIDKSYNIDIKDLASKITSKTKTAILQHTFGAPARVQDIIAVCKQNSITTIEDCAHVLGVKHKGQQLGTFADIGMFSFGSDKVISCVRGGALITNNKILHASLKKNNTQLKNMPLITIKRHLLHLPLFYLGKKLYSVGMGKALLFVAKKLYLTNRIIRNEEKRGQQAHMFPSKLPNALAHILYNQVGDLDTVNEHRKHISQLYSDNLHNSHISKPKQGSDTPFLRYPLQVKDPKHMHAQAKQKGMLLGDWYSTVVAPADIDMKATHYTKGMCPVAEELSEHSINLPTHRGISTQDAQTIIDFCNTYDPR